MKRVLFLIILLSLFSISSCDRSFEDGNIGFNNPSAREVQEKFANPPVEYSISFYWGWDGNVTEEVISRDMDRFKANNVHIVSLEPGYEMGASYLSEGWFNKVDTAVQLAKERDMRVYIVDEGKYPSGFAGGKIAQQVPELSMKILIPSDSVIHLSSGDSISLTLSEEVVSALAYNRGNATAEILDVNDGMLNWKVPEGEWSIMMAQHALRSSPTRSVNNPAKGKDPSHALIDYLDSTATGKFIEFTHEEYRKYVGEEFGKTILGFRGDEPDYSIRGIPWTPAIFDMFKEQKGYDIRPFVSTFFGEKLTEEQRRMKADYWDVWSTLFADNFFKVQTDWCAVHGMDYLVHLNHEDDMIKLARSEGDLFKTLRSVQMPGVDAIWHQIWPGEMNPVFPKYASSVAHVNGHPRSFTESFAAYMPRPDLDQAKWILDQQLVRGINMVEVMFVPASSRGRSGMTGWLADDRFPEVAKYIHRACYLLSQGTPAAKTAFLYPVSSIWLGDHAADSTALNIMEILLNAQHDFDVIDEQAIESIMTLEEGNFINKSGQSYSTIIIPPLSALSSKVIQRLKTFQEKGGKVISIGDGPILSVENNFRDAEPTSFPWSIDILSDKWSQHLLDALDSSDFRLTTPNPSIKYLHRKWKDADLYFIFNEGDERFKQKITLEGVGRVQIWDAMDGKVMNYSGRTIDADHVEVDLALEPWETRFLVINRQQDIVAGVPVNYDEAKTGTWQLPDPLTFENGDPVTNASEWIEKRRPEIIRLYESEQFGKAPQRVKRKVDLFEPGTPALEGKAVRKQATLYLTEDTASHKADLLLYLPADVKEPAPLFLMISFMPNSMTVNDPAIRPGYMWNREGERVSVQPRGGESRMRGIDVDKFIAEGIGVGTIYYGDIEPDFAEGIRQGVRGHYLPQGKEWPKPDEWGTISAWAWGLGYAMDYLETDPDIDAAKVALHGVSRLGKTVLWAGALDQRFAMILASCSGEGGAALSMRDYGETIAHMVAPSRYFYQFCGNRAKYADDPQSSPIDAHMLLSLIAPRPLLLQTGNTDGWSDPKGEFLAAVAAEPVYNLFGKKGLETDVMPDAGVPILHDLGYYMHAGGHGTLPGDYNIFIDFMKKHFLDRE